MTALLLLFLAAPLPAADPTGHETRNPLYEQLRQKGVPISDKEQSALPAPLMADGLDGPAQIAVIKRLIGEDIDWSVFTDNSINAPQMLLPLRTIAGGDPQAPARAMDLYFIAYGPLKKLTDKGVLERVAGDNRKQGEGKALTSEDLKKRGINVAPENEKREGYGYAVFNLMDRVDLRSTGHTFWSETPESLLLAARIDERFAQDPQFPNQWRSLTKEADGTKAGPPHPYAGAGYYLKVTQLKDPGLKGALFCEIHEIFTEPTGWFQGTNQLTAKLPAVAQDLVRKLRRELKK